MEEFNDFIKALKVHLEGPLPGIEAQLKLEPSTRKIALKTNHAEAAKESAVLILLYPKSNEIYTVFIKRPVYDGVHSGQIALPGGQLEEKDPSLIGTALREAQEEIGLNPKNVNVLGKLTTLYIPPSNFNVLPVVAYTTTEPEFVIDPIEVDAILQIPVRQLLRPENIKYEYVISRNQIKVSVPCYYLNQEIIWGATAMIISEFTEIITKCG